MVVKTFGSAVHGVDATTIAVEVNVGGGTKYFIVGLPDNAIKECTKKKQYHINTNNSTWDRL